MKVAGRNKLEDFKAEHADAVTALDSWLREVRAAQWRTPQDVKARYVKASILKDNRVVFNIGGGRYRLDVKISYEAQTVLVVRIGTHADYDTWRF